MNRREFLGWVGVGLVASSLPVAIAACSEKTGSSESKGANSTRPDGFQPVGMVSQLDQQGQILNKKSPVGSVSVIRNPNDANTLLAVDPTCTHQGCTVEWKGNEKKYICPCHASEFSPEGKLLKAPAKKALTAYQVKLEGTSVLVKSV